ncbi:hypothetical protein MPSEU_000991400 [Mayamaea pseudoterrestris]|nr:hypothetical protein MPSEU_000991400 [Mayamaea pseudoterrestris]
MILLTPATGIISSLVGLKKTSLVSSSALLLSTMEDGGTFDPILPDASQLVAFGSIAALTAVAVYVWATEVVPVSRTNLAISKRSGAVKDYLEELQDVGNMTSTDGDTRKVERWLFTDWLNALDRSNKRINGRQKEPALPILKNAKWNSGDNPVLAATGLILLGVLFTSITERVSSML